VSWIGFEEASSSQPLFKKLDQISLPISTVRYRFLSFRTCRPSRGAPKIGEKLKKKLFFTNGIILSIYLADLTEAGRLRKESGPESTGRVSGE